MCGIAGMLNWEGRGVDRATLDKMIRLVSHRGPDESGVYADNYVGLAHARLSIIDLASGQQPMHNEDKSLWITFNGEIYNYVELREYLTRRGHRFLTRSDTEVILHLYEEKGEQCVQYFNGQWAFALWDVRRRQLFLSRDRLGVRPLFYTTTGQNVIFGSEIKSILAHPAVRRDLDLYALDQLFTFWVTLPPRTLFKGVMELPPGHTMVLKDGKIRIDQYWRLDFTPCSEPLAEKECADKLLELLTDATRLRLRSDVPVGAYLSGGLDSTVITALMKRVRPSQIKTFSVTFQDPEFDESAFQKEAREFLETDHEELHCSNSEIGRVFPEVIWYTEKPILRTAPAPLYLLSKLVRERGYKVVLTGEGSDEMFGGYDIFKEAKIRRFIARFPKSQIRPLLLKRLYPYIQNLHLQSEIYLRAFFTHVKDEERANPFFSHMPRWELTSRLKMFFSNAVRSEVDGYDALAELRETLPDEFFNWDGFSQAQYLEAVCLLPGYILSSQGDRMAMAQAVEGRFPFLDHRVVEFAAKIPPTLKMKGLNEKFILKRSAGDLIPAAIKNRPKQPYRAPDVKSFYDEGTHAARFEYVEELLSEGKIKQYDIFNPQAVQKLVEKAKSAKVIGVKDNMALVGVLSTQLLLNQFRDKMGENSRCATH